jgi:hypothetical protein
MDSTRSSETSVRIRSTWHNIKRLILHSHLCQNPKSYRLRIVCANYYNLLIKILLCPCSIKHYNVNTAPARSEWLVRHPSRLTLRERARDNRWMRLGGICNQSRTLSRRVKHWLGREPNPSSPARRYAYSTILTLHKLLISYT